ncbi:MAG: methionyl-tRNA formyltransferase [Deltaproteobacteria bacterium]|nr:MAG: methionyl-tRNA formyltransferase [Deltaproteobacteria bacterium]
MGTPDFAVNSLRALFEGEDEVVAVVTQPDREKGRGRRMVPSPIKVIAQEKRITVLQPEKIGDDHFLSRIKDYEPDLIVVVAYGQILTKFILNIPRYGCFNVHASLLPKYRGASPIQWAIIKGEEKTGVTIMQMDEGMDTGKILLQKEIPIAAEDNLKTLSDRLSRLGASTLLETLNLLKQDKLKAMAQDSSRASYAPLLSKKDGEIEWEKGAEEINNFIRGMNPWPGAFTYLEGKFLKILGAQVIERKVADRPGFITGTGPQGLEVATGDGSLLITELQPESKKKMMTADFLRGYRVEEGQRLGRQS